jgi:hypothetical protein
MQQPPPMVGHRVRDATRGLLQFALGVRHWCSHLRAGSHACLEMTCVSGDAAGAISKPSSRKAPARSEPTGECRRRSGWGGRLSQPHEAAGGENPVRYPLSGVVESRTDLADILMIAEHLTGLCCACAVAFTLANPLFAGDARQTLHRCPAFASHGLSGCLGLDEAFAKDAFQFPEDRLPNCSQS